MESTVANAFLLLLIGMITVFVVLSLVVLVGNVLINVINKIVPEKEEPMRSLIVHSIPPQQVAVLAAVVDHITGGHGQIDGIKRL